MFLDSNIFIGAYKDTEREGAACRRLIERISKGEQNAVTTPLVFDEVLYYFLNARGEAFAGIVWKNMMALRNLEILPVDEVVLQHVMPFVKAGLEPRDAFHAATMYANGVSTICSYDKGFDRVPSIKRQVPK